MIRLPINGQRISRNTSIVYENEADYAFRTDPVSTFSLVAGTVQVVDVSFRALSACREIHKNGSLAKHRDSQKITRCLLKTTRHLEKSYTKVPASAVKHSNDVINVSKKCSETAEEILAELNKLQRDPKGGFRQSLGKSILAFRKKPYLAEIQVKLDRYREVLNTRILSKLDFHALQQIESYNRLDQKVKDLAVALSEGRNTYEQVLATHTTVIKDHIDRRLNDRADEEAKLRNWQQFRDSLFYPEINARQEDIARSHEGTCRWIFGPPQARNETQSIGGDSNASFQHSDMEETRAQPWSNSKDSLELYSNASSQHSDMEETRAQPWSNFENWLEGDSKDPYWLSGKPGSGKSTLMKYISTEFSSYCQSHDKLSTWGDAVTCSFFFWNLGSSLQKNYGGFLRSLLLQIAEQRPEMIPIMSDQYDPTRSSQKGLYGSSSIRTWTEQRLDDALARFLKTKPPSMRVCMFIDGLDEFVGDEDHLINTIHLLSHAPSTKVCASSRPEQIFRQGFAASPQLKLQDLNYPDIHKATVERLMPILKAQVPCRQYELDELVHKVVEKSQGIFLWAHLMTKDLKKGARNADSIQELRKRLERTPETLDGLYEHMLSRLDKSYLQDAARYFHHLLVYQEVFESDWPSTTMPPTLLGFACIEEGVSSRQLHNDPGKLRFSTVQECCHRLEIRILTRCAGLVEVDEHKQYHVPCLEIKGTSSLPSDLPIDLADGITGCMREVKFIHKSAADFLRNHEEFFEDSNWQSTGVFSAVRAQIAVARLAPTIVSKPRLSNQGEDLIVVTRSFVGQLMRALCSEIGCCQAIRDTAIQLVDEIYDVLCYLNTTFNGPNCTMWESYPDLKSDIINPSEYRLGFAAYHGHHDYVAQYMASHSFSQADVEYILNCAILGCIWHFRFASTGWGLLRILLEYVPLSTDPYMISWDEFEIENSSRKPKWAAFASNSLFSIDKVIYLRKGSQYFPEFINRWLDVVKTFFVHDANANPNITLMSRTGILHSTVDMDVEIYIDETLLAYIGRIAATALARAAKIPWKDIEDFLRAHGGTSCRKVYAVKRRQGLFARVNDDQSNRLLSILRPSFPSAVILFDFRAEKSAAPTKSELVETEAIVAWVEKNLVPKASIGHDGSDE
ncbi:MAG: hypothetical protein Q9184_005877 [Pyrenodesmia sp. 2 TL-2023]